MSSKRIHQYEGPHDPKPPRYWRQAHRDWRFWVGLSLMLLAISVYILGNSRKTVAVSSAPPKGLAGSFPLWRRAAAPFALSDKLAFLPHR
jgi:hypothetical protein